MRICRVLPPLTITFMLSALLASPLSAEPSPSSVPTSAPTEQLREVGSTRLRVLLWTIYDSTLYSADGEFNRIEQDLALEITYRRSISAAELIERTFDEWRDMELSAANQSMWRSRLEEIWPDVESGDTLTLYVDDKLASRFYFNERFIGTMMDSDFTRQFLAIWLSEETDYPSQRAELIGSTD